MSEEIDPSVIQTTQTKLGKFIQKPQLTERLLKRPPFRFIHDIVSAAINQYGILGNVFNKDELSSENIKDKEAKMSYLRKLIGYLSTEIGEELKVKPSKIVAGSEPERTNELLQALAKVLEMKQSNKSLAKSNSSTEKINGHNKSPSTKIGKTETKAKVQVAKKATTDTNSTVLKGSSSSSKSKADVRLKHNQIKVKDGHKPDTPHSSTSKTLGKVPKSLSKPNDLNKDLELLKKNEGSNKVSSAKVTGNGRVKKDVTLVMNTLAMDTQPLDNLMHSEVFEEGFKEPTVSEVFTEEEPVKDIPSKELFPTIGGPPSPDSPDLGSADSGIMIEHPRSADLLNPRPATTTKSRQLSAKLPNDLDTKGKGEESMANEIDTEQMTKPLSAGSLMFDGAGKLTPPPFNMEEAFEKPPPIRTSSPMNIRPGSSSGLRPRSSRRPPSRINKDKLSLIRQDTRPLTSKVPNVVIEGNVLSDDEEDKIIQGAVLDVSTDFAVNGNDMLQGEQGKLVEQILSVQKDFVSFPDLGQDISNKDPNFNHVNQIKSLIQEVAQAVLPLSHLLPIIHEDMEVMYKEWQFWKNEADNLESQLNNENSSTDPQLIDLYNELELLVRTTANYQAKLAAAKGSRIRGENNVTMLISNFGRSG